MVQYEAVHFILTRPVKGSELKSRAALGAKRSGMKKAKVALARKLGVIMHQMLVNGPTSTRSWQPHDGGQGDKVRIVGRDHNARWQGPVAGKHGSRQAVNFGAAPWRLRAEA